LAEVIAAFTPRRCMFATNYSVEGIFKPYREVWNAYFECLSEFSADEHELMCWRNASRVYRMNL